MPLRLVILVVVGATLASSAVGTPLHETTASGLRSASMIDTLAIEGAVGETLIYTLPDELEGRPVLRFDPLRLPARSWMVDRAFFWKTGGVESGTHELRFRTIFRDAPPSELIVLATLEDES